MRKPGDPSRFVDGPVSKKRSKTSGFLGLEEPPDLLGNFIRRQDALSLSRTHGRVGRLDARGIVVDLPTGCVPGAAMRARAYCFITRQH
jgi:hypothetical protein